MKYNLQLALKQPEFMRTCLPMSEYFLKDSDNQNAIKIIARNKKIDKYRGLLDFAVVEMMPRLLKPLCIKFYADESFGNMVDHFHPVDNKRMDRILLESLKFAKSIHDQERRRGLTKDHPFVKNHLFKKPIQILNQIVCFLLNCMH